MSQKAKIQQTKKNCQRKPTKRRAAMKNKQKIKETKINNQKNAYKLRGK